MLKPIKALICSIALLSVAAFEQPALAKKNQPSGSGPAGPFLPCVVVETMNSEGYTYLCLEDNGEKIWVVVRERPVQVGEKVEVAGGPVMTNFTSEGLNRTFDVIIFSRGLVRK